MSDKVERMKRSAEEVKAAGELAQAWILSTVVPLFILALFGMGIMLCVGVIRIALTWGRGC